MTAIRAKSPKPADKGEQMKKKKLLYSAIVAVVLALLVALCVGCGEKTKNFSVLFKDGDTTVAEVVVESGATVKVPDYGKDG